MNTYNPYSLEGKRVLVTGASSGIGRGIAIECSRMGAKVVISGRNEARLQETLAMMQNPDEHQMLLADLAVDEEVQILVDRIEEGLDGIVLCAGFTIVKPFKFVSPQDIEAIMDVNYKAPVILSQKLLKKKKINKSASIVFISSVSGVFVSAPAAALYSGSKGAVNGVAKAMALDLSPRGIRVNCVNPGMVDTNIFSKGDITQEQLEEDVKHYPLGRYGKPEDIAYAVVYLLSDASAWVTGTNLKIDGGLTLM
jgi:NAD(P)-dependent dehydrogenase (short-subunit alcohol dehydrogenase family)